MFGYIRFGIADNLILMFAGMAMEKRIERSINWCLRHTPIELVIRNKVRLGIFIGMIGNAISDLFGGLAALNAELAIGTFIGCLIIVGIGIPITFRVTRKT